jgi:hypothetical protein
MAEQDPPREPLQPLPINEAAGRLEVPARCDDLLEAAPEAERVVEHVEHHFREAKRVCRADDTVWVWSGRGAVLSRIDANDEATLKRSLTGADYARTSEGGMIANLLRTGAVLLLRGDWLLELAGYRKRAELLEGTQGLLPGGMPYSFEQFGPEPEAGCGVLPVRQDCPKDAFHPPEVAVELWCQSEQVAAAHKLDDLGGANSLHAGALFLHSVSYCWITPEHSDPEGFHLRRLARALAALRAMREKMIQEGGSTNGLPADFPLDVGVFWDGGSLYQNHCGFRRNPVENDYFVSALHHMQLLYGHSHVVVLKLTVVPDCTQPLDEDRRYAAVVQGKSKQLGWLYNDKGWPFFESSLCNANPAIYGSRLELGEGFDEGLDEGLTSVASDGDAMLKLFSDQFGNEWFDTKRAEVARPTEAARKRYSGPFVLRFYAGRFGGGRAPPLHPNRFEVELRRRTFAVDADAPMVSGLYRDTFEKMSAQTEVMDCWNVGWDSADAERLGEALAAGWPKLRILGVHWNRIGDAGVAALAASLPLLPNLTRLLLGQTGIRAGGVKALAAALPSVSKLKELLLQENDMGDAGAEALAAVLPDLKDLKHLELFGNGISNPMAIKIIEEWGEATGCTVLFTGPTQF